MVRYAVGGSLQSLGHGLLWSPGRCIPLGIGPGLYGNAIAGARQERLRELEISDFLKSLISTHCRNSPILTSIQNQRGHTPPSKSPLSLGVFSQLRTTLFPAIG